MTIKEQRLALQAAREKACKRIKDYDRQLQELMESCPHTGEIITEEGRKYFGHGTEIHQHCADCEYELYSEHSQIWGKKRPVEGKAS